MRLLSHALPTGLRGLASVLLSLVIAGVLAGQAVAAPAQPGMAGSAQKAISAPYAWMYNFHSGKCISVPHSSTAGGARLWQYGCLNQANFGWLPEHGFSGVEYFFRNEHSGKCLAVNNSSKAAGAAIVQRACRLANPPLNQRFEFVSEGFHHNYTWYFVRSVLSALCLNTVGNSKANSAYLQQWSCPDPTHPRPSEWFIVLSPGAHPGCPCTGLAPPLAAPAKEPSVG
jgi:hypothetical protein